MNIYVITWRWADGSGSGALPWAFTDRKVAELSLEVLRQEGNKVYELAAVQLMDTLGILPKMMAQSERATVYLNRQVPHYGVEGRTPFDAGVLTIRLLNALRMEDITTLEQVVCWTERELLKVPNMGRKSINELKEYLHSKGFKLKGQS